MSGIVERLEKMSTTYGEWDEARSLCAEAAARIEELKAENEKLKQWLQDDWTREVTP